jgi:hypothetical protein
LAPVAYVVSAIRGITSRLESFSRSHDAVIRVYGAAGVIETHEHKGDFKEW